MLSMGAIVVCIVVLVALNRIFFQYLANMDRFGNSTLCLLQSDIVLAKLPKLT